MYKETAGRAARLLERDWKIERWIERLLPVQEAVTCAKDHTVGSPKRLLRVHGGNYYYLSKDYGRLLVHKVYQLSQLSTKAASGIN